MDKFRPTIIRSMKKYNKFKFAKDVYAGIMVSIIAIPLSIALAIASGVRPENGLYSAIIGGVLVAMFSGSRVQIGGITAATVMTVNLIISHYGMAGLALSSIFAGIMLVLMGAFKFGRLLKYIPITITTGFTAGIAIGIFTSQIKEFLGLTVEDMPIQMYKKWIACFESIDTVNYWAIIIGVISLALMLLYQKVSKRLPHTLLMIIVMTFFVHLLKIPVNTVHSIYGTVPGHFPQFVMPKWNFDLAMEVIPDSMTLAFLIAIVSLLSCVVTDGLIGKRHNPNMELIAQGIANIGCGFFGAVPVAGAVARSTASIKNGGKSQFVGIVHSISVALMLLLLMPLVGYIPMPSLAALLMLVAFRMINWNEIFYSIQKATKSDSVVLFTTIVVAIFVDLMTAIQVSIVMTAILFMKRMADVTTVENWKYEEENYEDERDDLDPDNIEHKIVPKDTQVYEICGPMFFAASEKLAEITPNKNCRKLILRMRTVTTIDATAMHRLEHLFDECKRKKITLILSHINDQPLSVMRKSGFDQRVGEDNFCAHIDDALQRAKEIG